MAKSIYNPSEIRKEAEEINFTILINSCCREFTNSTYYYGTPKYDKVLGDYFNKTGHNVHLKIDFPGDIEVYVPLRYISDSRSHQYYFPVVERNVQTDELKVIDIDRFLELIVSHALLKYPNASIDTIKGRLHNSMDNIEKYLKHDKGN
jgi:hypothetical protein